MNQSQAIIEAVSKKVKAFHGSGVPIRRFDRKFSAQGVFWFSEDKDNILRGSSGASSIKYLIEVVLTVKKTAGWDEYERLGLGEIQGLGFDSVKLDEDWIVFKSGQIKIVDTTKVGK